MPFVPQAQEKCTACEKNVYATEKVIVETKEKKLPYHKTCIRCNHCNQVLTLGTLVNHQNAFYCKPHFKQLFSSKGNYDEGFGQEKASAKWEGKTPVPTTTPSSFVPLTDTGEKKVEKKETSEETVNKIRAWRQEGSSEVCDVCGKVVYLAEKLVVEERNKKKLYHKNCFKCTSCDIILDLRNYGSHKEKIYCKTHLKEQLEINKPASSTFVSSKASFIPESEKTEGQAKEKSETPEHIKEKLRSFSSQTEKCTACGKTVYATERIIVEELKVQKPYHKNCLRCSHCNTKLDLSNYGSSKGVIYCLLHLKEIAKPEQARNNSFFVSPLKKQSEFVGDEQRQSQSNQYQDQNQREEDNKQQEERKEEQEEQEGQEEQKEEQKEEQEEEEEREQQTQEEKPEEPQQQSSSSSSTQNEEEEDSTAKRRREREERRKQLEEEERREEEERQRRAEERKRRLAALKDDS